jgi:hypothetical protein
VRIEPDSVPAHAALLRVLLAGGRRHEAEEQYELSLDMLAEAGDSTPGELTQTWRHLLGRPPVKITWPTTASSDHGLPAASAPAAAELPPKVPLEKPSVVVLPFANMSGDPEQNTSAMASPRISSPTFRCRPSSSSPGARLQLQGQGGQDRSAGPPAECRYALEGSVRKAGSQFA